MSKRRDRLMLKTVLMSLFMVWTVPGVLASQAAAQPAGQSPASPLSTPAGAPGPAPAVSAPAGDILGPGDRVQVTVFGETALTGEFIVSGVGDVSLPLIGNVHATGLTVPAFTQAVTARLADGYIRDPKVSAQVLTLRPFYILGEVAKPGEYPFSDDLTVMNAVAEAGGFTYRAEKKRILIRHSGASREVLTPLTASTPVQPGDTIRIRERFF